ncbi:MAG: hypothetical protein E6H09_15220 [Bacteroidetes bacterium]|jgi:uncharacterized protein YraI|nr:MAG: hypothetical protein E6H09_15220 [Bacteroidota bacterium]
MKRSPLSEKSLVAILFVLVIVVFSFAQADTDNFEKANLNTYSPPTSSLEQSTSSNPVASSLRSQ